MVDVVVDVVMMAEEVEVVVADVVMVVGWRLKRNGWQ